VALCQTTYYDTYVGRIMSEIADRSKLFDRFVILNKRSLRSEGSERAARRVALFATQ